MAFLPEDPQRKRYAIYSILGIAGLAFLGFQFVYEPRSEDVRESRERLEVLEQQNRTARAIAGRSGEDDVHAQLALYRDQLEVVEGLIPSAEELPTLLDRISVEAAQAGVELALIRPASVTAEEFYVRRVYDLAVLGSYHAIGDFLARIGSLPRIITPIDMAIQPRDGADDDGTEQRLEARFSIETYVVAENGGAGEDDDV